MVMKSVIWTVIITFCGGGGAFSKRAMKTDHKGSKSLMGVFRLLDL